MVREFFLPALGDPLAFVSNEGINASGFHKIVIFDEDIQDEVFFHAFQVTIVS